MKFALNLILLSVLSFVLSGCSSERGKMLEMREYILKSDYLYSNDQIDLFNYYGVYEGYLIFDIPQGYERPKLQISKIGKYEFVDYVISGFGLKAYKEEKFYLLKDLFDEGLISDEDLEKVNDKHKNMHPNRYNEEYPNYLEKEEIINMKIALKKSYNGTFFGLDHYIENRIIYGIFDDYVVFSWRYNRNSFRLPNKFTIGDFLFCSLEGDISLKSYKDNSFNYVNNLFEEKLLSNESIHDIFSEHVKKNPHLYPINY